MTQAEKDEVVRAHNSLRQKLASGGEKGKTGFSATASNMMKLVWDEELAFIAQAHADQCKFQADCRSCRKVDEYAVGQNLQMTSDRRPADGYEGNWTKVTQYWYDHIMDAPRTLVDRYQHSPSRALYYSPFSQVVWAETWKIGCGFTASTKDGEVQKLYVCNYGPSGNIEDLPTYKRGVSASQCPDNTAPAGDFPALCEALDSNGPKANEKKLREKSLFFCDFSDGTMCGLKIQHDNNAVIVKNNLFHYLSFRVSASQKVSIEMPESLIQSQKPYCLYFESRRGGSDGTDKSNSQFCELIMKKVGYSKGRMDGEQVEWHRYTVNPQVEGLLESVTWTFEVPAGASEQYFESKALSSLAASVSIHNGMGIQ